MGEGKIQNADTGSKLTANGRSIERRVQAQCEQNQPNMIALNHDCGGEPNSFYSRQLQSSETPGYRPCTLSGSSVILTGVGI